MFSFILYAIVRRFECSVQKARKSLKNSFYCVISCGDVSRVCRPTNMQVSQSSSVLATVLMLKWLLQYLYSVPTRKTAVTIHQNIIYMLYLHLISILLFFILMKNLYYMKDHWFIIFKGDHLDICFSETI